MINDSIEHKRGKEGKRRQKKTHTATLFKYRGRQRQKGSRPLFINDACNCLNHHTPVQKALFVLAAAPAVVAGWLLEDVPVREHLEVEVPVKGSREV
jgi:hypothetical protein